MNEGARYLRLSGAYCQYLGGLRWSATEDALEHEDGSTFAFNEEVALFLEGFAAGGRLIHFGFILHLLDLLRNREKTPAPGSLRLRHAFADTGRPLFNAGAFCAALCRDVPEATGPVHLMEIFAWLRNPARPIRWYIASFHDTFQPAEYPPLGPAAFEEEFLRRLGAYSQEEIRDWLRHGRGPVKDAGAALAREVPPPRTLAGALGALLERPRLAGARPFVAQMLSTLALPLRHPAPPELPVGGYADVTTHGPPDRLLLSQFALDEWDFLRRHADRELLYFRREEPHARPRHELIVLLDQGVRTWGDVRLVLSAAVLALGRKAVRGKLPFLVATTAGRGEVVDPLKADDERLGALVEASDLSANPGLALERVLERPAIGSRDVVLLTHPRNLQEPEVRAAALRAGTGTRLLALALDGRGQASLSELRHGVPVPVRQFRVDFSRSAPPPPEPEPPVPPLPRWTGNVEPVPFPFRFGTNGPVGGTFFDFDSAGKWLLTASRDGLLHVWTVDGSTHEEILPRALIQRTALTRIEAVVGVANGFVVGGYVTGWLAMVHYDMARRTCAAYNLGEQWPPPVSWRYSLRHHAVVVRSMEVGEPGLAIDLGTGSRFDPAHGGPPSRAVSAWFAEQSDLVPVPHNWHPLTPRREVLFLSASVPPSCHLDPDDGRIRVSGVNPAWESFVPLADGLPALRDCTILEAQCRGSVLAAKVRNDSSESTLWLFRGPAGVPLGQTRVARPELSFMLSTDGMLLAQQQRRGQIQVRETVGAGVPRLVTYAGRFSAEVRFMLGERWLLLETTGRHLFLLRWDGGSLQVVHVSAPTRAAPALRLEGLLLDFLSKQFSGRDVQLWGAAGTAAGVPGWLQYDATRFIAGAVTYFTVSTSPAVTYYVTAAADRFGQVAIFNNQRELVCMFFAFRDRLSGWLPDGTCFGPASHTGRPATEADLRKFGQALQRASDNRRD